MRHDARSGIQTERKHKPFAADRRHCECGDKDENVERSVTDALEMPGATDTYYDLVIFQEEPEELPPALRVLKYHARHAGSQGTRLGTILHHPRGYATLLIYG